MLKNVGSIDRVVRIVIGLALIAYALGYIAPGSPLHWLGWIGLVPLMTAAMGSCPLYGVFGMSTCPMKSTH